MKMLNRHAITSKPTSLVKPVLLLLSFIVGTDLASAKESDIKSSAPSNTLSTAITSHAGSRLTTSSSLAYSVRGDIAQEREPRVLSHRLSVGTSLTLLDRKVVQGFDDELADEIVTGSLAFAGQYTSVGQEIEETQDGVLEMTDLDFSLSRSLHLNDLGPARSTLDLVAGNVFPTSTATQYEGVQSVPYLSIASTLGFRGGLVNLSQAASTDYTVNTFRFSPTTRTINSDLSFSYNLGVSLRLGGGFKLGLGGNVRLTFYGRNFDVQSWQQPELELVTRELHDCASPYERRTSRGQTNESLVYR
ncbi:MAG: hypothetical protein IPJ84_14555 [Bdellovibrionales bacterium]|nr:hypothetical protein [Bdellovibrionales bacterium]